MILKRIPALVTDVRRIKNKAGIELATKLKNQHFKHSIKKVKKKIKNENFFCSKSTADYTDFFSHREHREKIKN